MNRSRLRLALFLGWLFSLGLSPALLAEDRLVLGMFAYRPKPLLEERFQPLASYLSQQLGDARVELRLLDLEEIEAALAANQLDLLFTNPSHYIRLRSDNSLTGALATLVRLEHGNPVSALGGVILTRADSPIQQLSDLRGRRIGIASSSYLGGYQAQALELQVQGIDLQRLTQLVKLGSHDRVVQALLAGEVDVGFVRTGVVEQMQAEGKLDMAQLRLINEQRLSGFPYWLSTRLYPEWPVVALPSLGERRGRRIASALLALDEDQPAARAAGLAGFNMPADYLPVEQLARQLQLPPFEVAPPVTFAEIWRQHRISVLGLIVALASILLLLILLIRRNRELHQLIREKMRTQKELELAASVFDNSREGILITDAAVRIIKVNDALCRSTGYAREELLGRNPSVLKSGRQDRAFYQQMWSRLSADGHWTGELWNRRKDDSLLAEMLTISRINDSQGRPMQFLGLFSDITALKEHERRLEHIAHFDALTGLPNRVLLADRLHQDMSQARRHQRRLALVYLDLDGFKPINDSYGHQVGDLLLTHVAQQMKAELREGDTIARLGGDEFVAVLTDLGPGAECFALFERLLAAASCPLSHDGLSLQVSASLGVSFYPQDEDIDADQLLRQADQAMYQAKLEGKGRYQLFDIERDRSTRDQHEDLKEVRQALAEDQFVLYYQPKVSLRTGEVVGLEALIRGQHPRRGLLLPDEFLRQLEQQPLIADLGDWVIRQALAQLDTWRLQGIVLEVSVNVAALQLQRPDFVERLQQQLQRWPEIAPRQLTLEVLETSALDDLARVSELIQGCRQLGLGFALDDFGTGYSSLAYLKRLPVTQLKIDRLFVADMLHDPDDFAIVEGVLGLANAFRLDVIAEGMETAAHGALLRQLGCEFAQGYGIARPLPAEQIPQWLADWRPEPAWSVIKPVRRDDQSILFACVEHRAWVDSVVEFLRGQARNQPVLDPHQCRFALWLEREGRQRTEFKPLLPEIERIHQQVHQLAQRLSEQRPRGADLEQGIAQLHNLRDHLLALLRSMVGLFV
ncbi:MAG: EAL domain-containing protein [Gammaproteobacteria bacterium]|nr:EAL domain-containing protein [Gammaproteobacteria bacterium]